MLLFYCHYVNLLGKWINSPHHPPEEYAISCPQINHIAIVCHSMIPPSAVVKDGHKVDDAENNESHNWANNLDKATLMYFFSWDSLKNVTAIKLLGGRPNGINE